MIFHEVRRRRGMVLALGGPARLLFLGTIAFLLVTLVPAVSGADHTAYSTRVSNSPAGGDPGYFYVGGPLNVTLRDSRERDQRYELCMTPAPIDRDSCTSGRAGRPITGLAPSEAGRTKLRFEVPDGPVIVRYIRVGRPAASACAPRSSTCSPSPTAGTSASSSRARA
jgi:hypothetical protein